MAHVVVLGGVGLLLLYQRMSTGQLLAVIAFSQAVTLKENLIGGARCVPPGHAGGRVVARRARRGQRPQRLAGAGRPAGGLRAQPQRPGDPPGSGLDRRLHHGRSGPALVLGLILLGAGAVVLAYGLILRFFALELTMRPVLEDISGDLAQGADLGSATVSLRFKLLAALPAINVITGVTVAALSTRGQAHLSDLGVDVLVAVVVAFTISFELTILVSRSILGPIQALREATERVKHGDFAARVPGRLDRRGRRAGRVLQRDGGGPSGAREAARGVRHLRRPGPGRAHPRRGHRARGPGGGGVDRLPRHPPVHRLRRAGQRARGGQHAQRLLRARRAGHHPQRRTREQVRRRWADGRLRCPRPSRGPRRPRGQDGPRDRAPGGGHLRRAG